MRWVSGCRVPAAYDTLSPSERVRYLAPTVSRGERLDNVASRYRVAADAIRAANLGVPWLGFVPVLDWSFRQRPFRRRKTFGPPGGGRPRPWRAAATLRRVNAAR